MRHDVVNKTYLFHESDFVIVNKEKRNQVTYILHRTFFQNNQMKCNASFHTFSYLRCYPCLCLAIAQLKRSTKSICNTMRSLRYKLYSTLKSIFIRDT